MKTLICLLLLCGSLQASDLDTTIVRVSTGVGSVPAHSRSVTFIFDSGCTVLIAGLNTFTGTDGSLTLEAPTGDTLNTTTYNVTAGGMRVAYTR